jgi:hypothetical protein
MRPSTVSATFIYKNNYTFQKNIPHENDLQSQSLLALHTTNCLTKLRVFVPKVNGCVRIIETAACFFWERTSVEELHRYGEKLQKSFQNCLQSMDSSSGNKLTFSKSKTKVLSTECDVFEDGVTLINSVFLDPSSLHSLLSPLIS